MFLLNQGRTILMAAAFVLYSLNLVVVRVGMGYGPYINYGESTFCRFPPPPELPTKKYFSTHIDGDRSLLWIPEAAYEGYVRVLLILRSDVIPPNPLPSLPSHLISPHLALSPHPPSFYCLSHYSFHLLSSAYFYLFIANRTLTLSLSLFLGGPRANTQRTPSTRTTSRAGCGHARSGWRRWGGGRLIRYVRLGPPSALSAFCSFAFLRIFVVAVTSSSMPAF
jgi:hypothetical protein